jgi:TolA-binding protein
MTLVASLKIWLFAGLAATAMSACMTPQQKKDMEDNIYRLQTRVLQLETNVSTNRALDQKTGEQHHKTIASTSSDVERLNLEIKRMKGDIDALRTGIQTGQMPGQEGPQEGSVGQQLAEIRARLDAIEANQKDLMATIDKSSDRQGDKSASNGKKQEKKDASGSHVDATSIQSAFERKKFKEVVEDAPSALKKSKGKEREQILIAYGESLLKIGRPKEAALQFNEVIESKPSDKNMALAKLRLGDAFKAMGDRDTSRLFYDEVATKYANTPEGDKAKKALKSKK